MIILHPYSNKLLVLSHQYSISFINRNTT